MLDAIVPAWNEGKTVADVVRALRKSRRFAVTVVDDGSTDDTVARATEAGARVIPASLGVTRAPGPKGNYGKAQAMRAGLLSTTSDPVGFFDADLRGFYPHHAERFYSLSSMGYDMVCGLRDGTRLGALVGPLITGERVVRRWVMNAIPETCYDGYLIEIGMNQAASRGRTALFVMDGVTIVHSSEKFGFMGSLIKEWKMFSRIWRSQRALDACGSCDPAQCARVSK